MNTSQRKAARKLFYTALAHIKKQGCASTDITGDGCLYIKTYNTEMEGRPASDLLLEYPKRLYAWVRACQGDFADEIQSAHDAASLRSNFMTAFINNMTSITRRYPELNLSVSDK